jgi:hypothetical protein
MARPSPKAGNRRPTLRRLSPFGSGASLRALDNALETRGQRRIVAVHCRKDAADAVRLDAPDLSMARYSHGYAGVS